MSRVLENVNLTEAYTGPGRGDHPYPLQSVPNQEPRGMSNFVDGSGPIFSMYLEMATEEDKKMVEGWKADADGTLIFTGLFSAAVASLISVTIQDIRPNPQDTSNFYLANIYQTLADPGSNISGSLPASPPPFYPPNYAVWVNALLFLSLVISISCALLATLLQQWARRYLKVTQLRYSPHKRARIRAFFFEGVDKFLLPWAVEALPTLLHVSLFLFFAGISVFLWNVNLTIFKSVVSWIGICIALYGCITFVPIFHHDSPYHTPLSLPARHIVTGIPYVIFRALRKLTWLDCFSHESHDRFQSLEERYYKQLVQGMQKTAEETALNAPSEIDTRAFLWTFDNLDEDHELERFFSNLPGFRRSKVVDDPLPGLTEEQKEKLSVGLMGLLDITFSSDLPDFVKDRRAIICAKAFDPAHIPVSDVFYKIWSRCQYSAPISTEIVQIMSGWDGNTNLVAAVCTIIARAQTRDEPWFILASNELEVQECVLQEYAAHGDTLPLAVLIHIARRQLNHFREEPWPEVEFSETLEAASKFNAQDTLPELQHRFCILWNHIVLTAQNSSSQMARLLLKPIRHVYTALHQETDSSPRFGDPWDLSSYTLCNVPGHLPDTTPHIHDDSASTTFAGAALRDNIAPVPSSFSTPDAPSLSLLDPPHVTESLADVPPLDDFYLEHQTPTEGLHIHATEPDTATTSAGAIRDVVPLGIAMPYPSPGTFPPAPPTSITSTSLSGAITFQHTAERRTSPGAIHVPSLPSPPSVLNNMLPTESQSSPLAPAAPNPSHPLLSSASDINAAEGGGSAKATFHEDGDAALDLPSSIRDNIIAAPDLPSQPPPPLSITDVTIAVPSWCSPGAENTGDRPPRPSYGRYDIV